MWSFPSARSFAIHSKTEMSAWRAFCVSCVCVRVFCVAVEEFIDHVDATVGYGHGRRVIKLVLLGAPLFVAVVAVAFNVMFGESVTSRADIKQI